LILLQQVRALQLAQQRQGQSFSRASRLQHIALARGRNAGFAGAQDAQQSQGLAPQAVRIVEIGIVHAASPFLEVLAARV
jgi:hypothetical protein